MPYRAAFFDRDRTLLTRDPAALAERNALFAAWTGVPFACGPEEQTQLFAEAGYPERVFHAHRADEAFCLEEERAFWRRFYACKLRRANVTEDVDEKAARLERAAWLTGYTPYPETVETLERLRARGFLMGVISDTSPSLRLTVEAAGLGAYFSSYTCSDCVGVMKPAPAIYRAALDSLRVTVAESLYVDDYDVEADGARALGMTAFHIVRNGEACRSPWDIRSLAELAAFAEAESSLKNPDA